MSANLIPPMRWAQRRDRIFLKIDISEAKNVEVKLEENKLSLSAKTNDKNYNVELEFFSSIDSTESNHFVRPRYIEFFIKKKESGPYWSRLLKTEQKPWFLKVDWQHWKDEEDDEDGDVDNFGQFGEQQPPLEGEDDDDEDDDEEDD
eukprot:TRINITY_DN6_c3_g1_i2.p1 TRINITY_DN6_c3_g1~~TRINITY_DN6_c3_g1_i2.p1  ORF type:complete len:147 (-),score=88.71 TRINITY_DN6_c3_g1_i2:189-629(-)